MAGDRHDDARIVVFGKEGMVNAKIVELLFPILEPWNEHSIPGTFHENAMYADLVLFLLSLDAYEMSEYISIYIVLYRLWTMIDNEKMVERWKLLIIIDWKECFVLK